MPRVDFLSHSIHDSPFRSINAFTLIHIGGVELPGPSFAPPRRDDMMHRPPLQPQAEQEEEEERARS